MSLRARLGWGMAFVSLPVWGAAFAVVPFLPLSLADKAKAAGVALGLGELLFWVGVALAGPELLAWFRGPPKGDPGL